MLELSHVYFSYTEEQKLIEDFNLKVQPGQRIAIVGPTGCGKTTLINLLMRFYDVTGGKISVEGCDVRGCDEKEPAEKLRHGASGYLAESRHHPGKHRDGKAGRHGGGNHRGRRRPPTPTALLSVCRRGYETVITEEGGGLSQGQKQLLCIARVMLCLPPMLILDEATSSIDTRDGNEDSGSLPSYDGGAHQLYRSPQTFHHPGGRM